MWLQSSIDGDWYDNNATGGFSQNPVGGNVCVDQTGNDFPIDSEYISP
jgi:hypothetical protein